MSDMLNVLVGRHIERMDTIHDYIQLIFNDGVILNIFNTYSIFDATISGLPGSEISAINRNDEFITIFMLPSGSIQVGLKDSDYRGPEAMEFISKNSPPVVWP